MLLVTRSGEPLPFPQYVELMNHWQHLYDAGRLLNTMEVQQVFKVYGWTSGQLTRWLRDGYLSACDDADHFYIAELDYLKAQFGKVKVPASA